MCNARLHVACNPQDGDECSALSSGFFSLALRWSKTLGLAYLYPLVDHQLSGESAIDLAKFHSKLNLTESIRLCKYFFHPKCNYLDLSMIRCHLGRLMGERKMNIADVMRETGIKRTMLTLMYKDEVQRLDMDALDKLCRLFACEVKDLLEFDSSAPQKEAE